MSNPVGHVPTHSGPLSAVEEIFRDNQRGGLSKRDYEIMSSAWVSENLQEYQPMDYPPLSGELKQYIDSRYERRMEWDVSTGKRLVDWIYSVIQAMNQNGADFELLTWSRQKLSEVKLTAPIGKVDWALARFERLIVPGVFNKAMRVQKMDRDARIAKNGG